MQNPARLKTGAVKSAVNRTNTDSETPSIDQLAETLKRLSPSDRERLLDALYRDSHDPLTNE